MNRSGTRRIVAHLVGGVTAGLAFAMLYLVVWIPGLLVLALAFVGGLLGGRAMGLRGPQITTAPGVVCAVLAPMLLPTLDLTQIAVLGIAGLGLHVLLGLSGQLSLAQGIMVGLGAYTTAILATNYGWPVLMTMPVAAITAGVAGWALGLMAVRFEGVYLVILTGAFAIVMPILLKHFEGLTGGVQGIAIAAPDSPFQALDHDRWLYYLVLSGVIVATVLTANLERSSVGISLRALRDSGVAARSIGIDLRRGKMQAFVVSSVLAGLAGGFYAITVGFVSPDSFGLLYGIHFLILVVLGGSRLVIGVFLGAGVLHVMQTHLHEVAVPIAPDYSLTFGPQAVYAAVLILVLLLMPHGLTGAPEGISAWWRSRVSDRSSAPSHSGHPAMTQATVPTVEPIYNTPERQT